MTLKQDQLQYMKERFMDVVMGDLGRHTEQYSRMEAEELEREKETNRLISTEEGIDEVLAELLDRPDSIAKNGFLEHMLNIMTKPLANSSSDELQIKATLLCVAETMARSREKL